MTEQPNWENLENGIWAIAKALRALGNANAATPMGAIEAHGVAIKDGGHLIAEGLQAIAEAIHRVVDEGIAVREEEKE